MAVRNSLFRSVSHLALISISAGMLCACAAAPTNDEAGLERSEWLAVEVSGKTADDRTNSTLRFPDEGTVEGNSACNQFNATVKIDGNTISLGPITATERRCGLPDDDLEKAYLAALGEAKTWEIDINTLRLMDAGGKMLIRFKRLGTTF